ncbi:GlxA family transcriptional regulator [Nocardia brasiliensis]|uniref:GlxA family transcriptional regulator n=1 Tax=Nocardia brasiliensis TaxID=37326 RepID=UPI0004A6D1BA|nr:helix-turn-helix domain-containing protein [Nocardia brasiliensis]MBF6125298.1 helix-turn-helix domain-containing protein [Nocardia brasiliensis]MBF6545031.1 helix-turn-helix domain-containing protein [Nocardia brasiliensis]
MTGRTVAIAVTPGAMHPWDLYELGVLASIFGTPQPDIAADWYELRICSVLPGTAESAIGHGAFLRAEYGVAELVAADTVFIPSIAYDCTTDNRPVPPELIDALVAAHRRGARMVALCSGTFVLAAAGLLDGRRATVGWEHAAVLARRFPAVEVDGSALYVDDGDILTSSGMTAALDLSLHLVRRDFGAPVANRLARRLMVPPNRAGGQAQFIDLSVTARAAADLGPVLEWAGAHLDEPLTVDQLAARAAMSPRTFHRRVQQSIGVTPKQWLLTQRLARAQSLLESTDHPIDRVSRMCGLGTAANLRRHFAAVVGVTPAEYRRTFELREPPAA